MNLQETIKSDTYSIHEDYASPDRGYCGWCGYDALAEADEASHLLGGRGGSSHL